MVAETADPQRCAASITIAVVTELPDKTYVQNTGPVFYTFDVFQANGGACTDSSIIYSALQSNSAALPSFLVLDPTSRTFTLSEPNIAGTTTIRVTGTNYNGDTTTFDWILTIINIAPLFDAVLVDQTIVGSTTPTYTLPTISDTNGDNVDIAISG